MIYYMRLLPLMIFPCMLFSNATMASDSVETKCKQVSFPLTYNDVVYQMLKIFANYEPSFSLTETKEEDKEYQVFLLKQEFKAEKGNQVYSSRYYEIMVELFLLGETEYLTLIWWETEDSISRLLIMSLFMCQDGDLDTERRIASFNIPPFALYCNRFKSDEANRRIQEIKLLQDNISNLRFQLRPVIKNCSSYK